MVVDVVRVILRVVLRKDLKEGAQRRDVDPHRTGEDGASRCLMTDEVLHLHLEGCHHILDPKRQV
jgi:hypothetical protein